MRTFAPEEANRLLPSIEPLLARAKTTLDRLRDVRDQLQDLRIVWGDKIETDACPDHAEYLSWKEHFVTLEAELRETLDGVRALGAEVKDPDIGLVDFLHQRGPEVVCLCWRRGESAIRYWHTVDSGYAGRQPLDTL